jgi:hypothetical protein
MDERLIELVRGHAELYNFTDNRYSDNMHKNKKWKEFGEILKKGTVLFFFVQNASHYG